MASPWRACGGGQGLHVAHRVGGLLRGQVSGVGDPPAGLLPGMGLHQHPAVEQLDQRRVGAGIQVPAEILLRRGVERPGDLDVEVAVDLHPGQDRHVIGRARQRQQLPGLGGGEHLGRPGLDRAVDPRPGCVAAPRFRAGLRVGQAGEVLAGEEVPPHVLHGPLHPRLVLRRPDPGRVGREPAVLGVIQPARGEPRVHRVRVRDDRRGVIGDQDLEHPAEERPRRVAPGDQRAQRLGEAQPHEHVPRVARGEDQRVHLPPPPRHRVRQHAQVPEVDLALRARLAVGDPDRGRGLPEPAPLHAEPVQSPVRHHHPLPLQQHPDLHHRQAGLDLRLDLLPAGLQLVPRLPVPARPHRPDRLRDLPDQLIGELSHPAVARQPRLHRRLHIPAGRLAVHPRLRRHLPQARP